MRILIVSVLAAIASVLAALSAEHLTRPVSVVGNFLQLTLSYNPGIAFGLSIPYPLQEILIAIALCVMLILAFKAKHDRFSSLAFGLIIGGAVGNLIDRIPDGLVTDYLSVGTFPIFNVADACITVGAGILVMQSMRKKSIISQ